MTFKEILTILGIEKYEKRILSSNSHGELFHLLQYAELAEKVGKTDWFPKWFSIVVKEAEVTWKRPESVFQHIKRILIEDIKNKIDEKR